VARSKDGHSDHRRQVKSELGPLCPIVDVDVAGRAGWRCPDLAAAYLAGGARCLQLRAKSIMSGPFLDLAMQLKALTDAADATLIVNDRADIARLAGAGLHVGQEDLEPSSARAIVGDAAVLGVSTHTRAQLDAAVRAPVDYVAVGPVFGTTTKHTGYQAVGLDAVRYAAERARPRGLLVVAIGGITLERAVEVVSAGADTLAVITDLIAGGDPEARVRAYRERLREVGKV
jgi:thiamine-phosphate pyrophosphorylase